MDHSNTVKYKIKIATILTDLKRHLLKDYAESSPPSNGGGGVSLGFQSPLEKQSQQTHFSGLGTSGLHVVSANAGTRDLGVPKTTAKPARLGLAQPRSQPAVPGVRLGRIHSGRRRVRARRETAVQVHATCRVRIEPVPDAARLVSVQLPFAQRPFGRYTGIPGKVDPRPRGPFHFLTKQKKTTTPSPITRLSYPAHRCLLFKKTLSIID